MGRMMTWVVVMLTALVMAGCFQVDRVVTVKPDGSGTLEERVMFSKKIMQGITAAFQSEGGGEKAPELDMYDEKGLKSAVQGMGKGVRYVSSAKVSDEKFTGYRVVYAFENINDLQVDNGPPSLDKKPGTVNPDQGMRFIFKAAKGGAPALLTLKSAKEKATKGEETATKGETATAPEAPRAEPTQQELDLLKGMLDGLRFSFSVVVAGTVVDTNASHCDNSRITLADVDFSQLLSLGAKELKSLNEVREKDMPAVMAALKGIPGVKVDLNDEVRVSFR